MTDDPRRVRVAVEAVADRPERTFTYAVPAGPPAPEPGSLVLVPYGRRLALGYVMPGRAEETDTELKEIEAVVSEPMLPADLLSLAPEIAVYYRAPIGTTVAAMLPPGLESRLRRRWHVEDPDRLPDELAGAADADGWLADAQLQRRAPRRTRAAWVEKLRRRGVV